MRISVIQPDILWENKILNFRKYEKIISELHNPDIIILPEMFTTGFTMNSVTLCESSRSETFRWMRFISEESNAGICGSYIVKEKNHFYNRWIFVAPGNKSWSYNKRHLFRMNNVENNFTAGRKPLLFRFRGLRICANVCYDLRFPVWSRNRNDYDLLINSANWPQVRRDVWLILLRARAIENMAWVAGANRIGTDGAGIKYCGDSMIINPKGEIMASAGKNRECTVSADLSSDDLKAFREKFPAHLDADKFIIKP